MTQWKEVGRRVGRLVRAVSVVRRASGAVVEGLEQRTLLTDTPALAWSSYLGGSGEDQGLAIAIDGGGNAWVTGVTSSPDFASGGFDTTLDGGEDAFVAKINADGTLAWSSYLGGSGRDAGGGIAIDGSGNAWVTGSTDSTDFASGGFDNSYNGDTDAFVAKINADGTLAWSSYLGGSGGDGGSGIAIDGSGNVWVTGITASTDFPSNGFDSSLRGSQDAFVAKISADGTLVWSSYLGDSNNEEDCHIATDVNGNAWVQGDIGHPDDVLMDYFTAKITADGTLAWLNIYGSQGQNDEGGVSIATDSSGNARVGYIDGAKKINADGSLAWATRLTAARWGGGLDQGGIIWLQELARKEVLPRIFRITRMNSSF